MNKKVLLLKDKEGIWTYLLEDDEVAEIHFDRAHDPKNRPHHLGNIYIGKVKKILSNLGAAFIEIAPGYECYYDISLAKKAFFTEKKGKKPLTVGDELLVQLSKDAVKTKAPTVSSNLSFTGYYSILTTGNTRMGVSAKISKSRREEYKERLKHFENESYGIIIRTNGKDVPFSVIEAEIESHIKAYEKLISISSSRTCFSCVKAAPPGYITNLKNIYAEGLSEIIVDDHELFQDVQEYYRQQKPGAVDSIRFYKDHMLSLASLYNTEKALDRALGERIWLKNGAYLVIQPTEALTVIDVNSGKYSKQGTNGESALTINLEAAKVLAKQLRLRNLSGIIIVDFINMEDEVATAELIIQLKLHLAKDPIQASFVDMTALQLVEITRKKIRKPLAETLYYRQG